MLTLFPSLSLRHYFHLRKYSLHNYCTFKLGYYDHSNDEDGASLLAEHVITLNYSAIVCISVSLVDS